MHDTTRWEAAFHPIRRARESITDPMLSLLSSISQLYFRPFDAAFNRCDSTRRGDGCIKASPGRHEEGESGMYDAEILAPGSTLEITDQFTSVLRKVEHGGARSGLIRGLLGEQ